MFVDTHCHIHSSDYPLPVDEVLLHSRDVKADRLICVGTDIADSKLAVEFVAHHETAWASIGIHPHEASKELGQFSHLARLVSSPKVVAIGECGLDYYYQHSSKEDQKELLRAHLQLANSAHFPLIFHVREAFDEFWPLFDSFSGLRGVLHSFTDTKANLEKALERGLFIGVNGIMTFTKSEVQKEMFKTIPLDKLVLETDAPFLTPAPMRGKVNEPAFISLIAKQIADLKGLSLADISSATSHNAINLFRLT